MHRNLAADTAGGTPSPVRVDVPPEEITRRHELIARVLDRASRLLDDAEGETDRLRSRVLQQAAGCLVAFAQEIAGNPNGSLPGCAH